MDDMNEVKIGLLNQLKSQREARMNLKNQPESILKLKKLFQIVHDQKYKFRALR